VDTPAPSAAEPFPSRPGSFPAAGVNALATISRRWLARGVDAVLVGLPVLVVASVVLVVQASGDPSADPSEAADTTAQALIWGAMVAVAVLYETLAVTLWGQTLGKFLLGVRVARQVNGRCPLWWEAALRIALPGVVATVPHPLAKAAAMALYVAAMFDPLRRGLPDRAAGTVVVRTR
jgi:uncharacterized RDD family membrane protein YckC